MDRKAWRAAIHGVAKSRTQRRDWTGLGNPVDNFLLCYESLEAEDHQTLSLLLSSPLTSTWIWPRVDERVWWVSGERLVDWLFPLTPFFLGSGQVSPLKPRIWSENLAFSCSYVQDSLETAISIFFLCPVGLKVFVHTYSCLTQRVLLSLFF